MLTNVSRPSAVDVLRPFAVGDTFYADTTSTLAKRVIGTTDQVYIVSGGIPVWSSTVTIATLSVVDSGFRVVGSSDATKKLAFEVDAQTAGKTLTIDTGAQTLDRTLSVPVLSGNTTLAVIGQAQTFTGIQTFSTPIASTSGGTGVNNAGTITNASNTTITGGGTLALAGFTLTTPATGTAAIRGVANTFSVTQTFSATSAVSISGTTGSGYTFGTFSGYGYMALNGDGSLSGTLGFFGGATGDNNLYFNAPSGNSVYARVNNADVLQMATGGITATPRITATGGVTVGTATLLTTNVALTNGAGASAGTMTNAPAVGNPTKWIPINDNGTTRYIPCW